MSTIESKYSVVVDQKEIKRTAFSCTDRVGGSPIQLFSRYDTIPDGKVGELYITVDVANDRGDKKAHCQIDCLFHRDKGGYITFDGIDIAPQKDDLGCRFEVAGHPTPSPDEMFTNIIVYAWGPLNVPLYWSWTIELRYRENKPEDYPESASFVPRMQMSIVGLREGKKLGWGGLKDGINHVLLSASYGWTNTPLFVRITEHWSFLHTKLFGTASYTDKLVLEAKRLGTGSSWTYDRSRADFEWATVSGDYGTGAVWLPGSSVYYSAQVNGFLKQRVLARSVTITLTPPKKVSFVWGRYDVKGWKNYPVT